MNSSHSTMTSRIHAPASLCILGNANVDTFVMSVFAVRTERSIFAPTMAALVSVCAIGEDCISTKRTSSSLKYTSTSILSVDGYIYKLLYEAEEKEVFGHFLRLMRTKTELKSVIYPEGVTPPSFTTVLQKYSCANFGPLNPAEARKCLRNFIIGAKSALDELHGIGLSHNDIRSPNFCFNVDFQVILIDLDRVWSIDEQ